MQAKAGLTGKEPNPIKRKRKGAVQKEKEVFSQGSGKKTQHKSKQKKHSTKEVSIKNKNKIPTYYYRVFSCPYESFCFIKASALIKHGKGKRLF